MSDHRFLIANTSVGSVGLVPVSFEELFQLQPEGSIPASYPRLPLIIPVYKFCNIYKCTGRIPRSPQLPQSNFYYIPNKE